MKTVIRITHKSSGIRLAEGPLGWGITPFEGNLYIRKKYLLTDGFKPNYIPGLCIYKFLYVWLNLELDDGTIIRNIGWMYWLPNPLFPFIWYRIGLPKIHPEIQIEEVKYISEVFNSKSLIQRVIKTTRVGDKKMSNSIINAFKTDTGIEVGAITTDQMIEVDRIAMEETGPNLFQMMENAGRNLALLAIELLGHGWQKANIVVLAGLGGNAGGGICAARHLANRQLDVNLALSNPARLREVMDFQRKIYSGTSGKEIEIPALSDLKPDLILDAVIGYNLKGAPRGTALELIQWGNASGAPILSLDVPSGVDSTTGKSEGEFIHAKWTMTLALPKTGLLPDKTGDLFLADIGIPEVVYENMSLSYSHPFGNRYRVPLSPA